jgi:hypothetical protein
MGADWAETSKTANELGLCMLERCSVQHGRGWVEIRGFARADIKNQQNGFFVDSAEQEKSINSNVLRTIEANILSKEPVHIPTFFFVFFHEIG